MDNILNTSERCNLFKAIAIKVWKKITRAHSFNVDVPEIGITNDILVDILEFRNTAVANFDVYAKPGYNEKVNGSDLDVFIETAPNQYKWFALQAKVLKKNNRYTTLRDGYTTTYPSYQWEKLQNLKRASGCNPYYLFYNGFNKKIALKKSSFSRASELKELDGRCFNSFDIEEFGCSIVDVDTVEKFALTQKKGRYVNPTFDDFHPTHAEPWSVLVCCFLKKEEIKLYSLKEIIDSNNDKKLIQEIIEEAGELIDKKDEKKDVEIESEYRNPISTAKKESEWDPAFAIVVRRTDSLEN